MKTDIYNLIILDESGSMSGVTNQTISGCNETINTIRTAQKEYAETQNHYVSIYAFQSNGSKPSRYLIKNQPIEKVEHINDEMYKPWGSTPLYDAVGSTLVDLKSIVEESEFAIGSVTIITDGYENDSKYYSHEKVANMIKSLKEIGWNFNFIGANIEVERVAESLNIKNYYEFNEDAEGTDKMFNLERKGRKKYYEKLQCCMYDMSMPKSADEKKKLFKKMNEAEKGYFEEEEEVNENK